MSKRLLKKLLIWIMVFTVMLSSIPFKKSFAESKDSETDVVFSDDCSNLKNAGWTVGHQNKNGVYITDHSNSLGTLEKGTMKEVPDGQYLIYADSTCTDDDYTVLTKNVTIGKGLWALEFNAKINDLVCYENVPGYGIYRGISFEICAGNQVTKITLNDKNKILCGDWNSWDTLTVNMPTDNNFHKWGIAYIGDGKIIVSLDDVKVGTFEGRISASSSPDKITIVNCIKDKYKSGTNEMYIDSIRMVKDNLPEWAKYDPRLGGYSIMPGSDSKSVEVIANTAEIPESWHGKENVAVYGKLYKDEKLVDEKSNILNKDSVYFNFNPQNEYGKMKLDLQLKYGENIIDEITKDVDIPKSVEIVKTNQELNSNSDSTYYFNNVNSMGTKGGINCINAGWKAINSQFKGSDSNGYIIESQGDSPEITLPLKLNGWFGVYVGYITGTQSFKVSDGQKEETINLNGGTIKKGEEYGDQLMGETFTLASNFNGNTISIIPIKDNNVRIAYIKLKSLTDDEIALYNKPDEGNNGKRVIYNNDAFSDFYSGYRETADDVRQYDADRYIGKDVSQIDYCMGVTFMLNYNSKYAGKPFEDSEKYDSLMRDGDKIARKSYYDIMDANGGKAPIQIVAERLHQDGLKLNASLRMDAFYSMDEDPWLNGKIYSQFSDCHVIDKDGNTQYQISYAYPKMQEYIRNILKEVTSFDYVDGVNLDFCRYPYIFGYESILTDGYKSKYGVNPKDETTTEGLNRWYQYKADILTQLMRDIRKDLKGKTISVRIPYNGYFEYGLDVKKWVNEGLIDVIIPSCISYEDFYDIKPFVDMVKGTKVTLYGGITADLSGHDLTKEEEDLMKRGITLNITSSYLSTQQYRLRAYQLYNAGVGTLYIFNDWKGTRSLGLIGDKVKINKWYNFAYTSEWLENSVVLDPSKTYKAALDSVTIKSDKSEISINNPTALSITGKLSDGTNADLSKANIEYFTDNPDTINFKNGSIIGLKAGTAKIWAKITLDNVTVQSNEIDIKVVNNNTAYLSDVQISVVKTDLIVGDSVDIKTVGHLSDGTAADLSRANIQYNISDNKIIDVINGKITAKAIGTANIIEIVKLNDHIVTSNKITITVSAAAQKPNGTGSKLPKTGSNIDTVMLFLIGFILIGFGCTFIIKKKFLINKK